MKAQICKLVWDIGAIAGGAVFVYGLLLAWRPLGFIVGGLLVAAICFFAGYAQIRREVAERMSNRGGAK